MYSVMGHPHPSRIGLPASRKPLRRQAAGARAKVPVNARRSSTCALDTFGVVLRPQHSNVMGGEKTVPLHESEIGSSPLHGNHAMNSRAAVRYRLHAGVVFHWLDSGGLSRESRGYTRDISPRGTFVFASDCPPKGTPVALEIALPTFTGYPRPLRIRADGCVLRVEAVATKGRSGGFAATCQRVVLCAY